MSNSFVCFAGDRFFLKRFILPDMVYHLDIDLFIESCELGHACAMSLNAFDGELTDYKLELVTSRLVGLISFDLFHSRLALLRDAFKAVEGVLYV